jgi:hypothetical protein
MKTCTREMYGKVHSRIPLLISSYISPELKSGHGQELVLVDGWEDRGNPNPGK